MQRKPEWLKVAIPQGSRWRSMSELVHRRGLHTVCDEAACPNKAECWGCGTATFMVLGELCTRGCRFCAVSTSAQGVPIRDDEPRQLALAVKELGLKYAVITSVDRDDLPDRGAGHFARCVTAIREENPSVQIEVLIPDYRGAEMDLILEARPDVIAHNVETVRRLQGVRDQRAGSDLSLQTLRDAKSRSFAPGTMTGGSPDDGIPGQDSPGKGMVTKSSLLLGIGETEAEIMETMDELRAVSCDILVMGQYLQPTTKQIPVVEYLTPETFARLADIAREKGFSSVVSSPLARTSYHAHEGFESSREPVPSSREPVPSSREPVPASDERQRK
jgi:lipoic acid synthetase